MHRLIIIFGFIGNKSMHLASAGFTFELNNFHFHMSELPPKANSYVKTNFENDASRIVQEIIDLHGKEVFEVVIFCEEAVYTLHFNRAGDLVFYSTKMR